MRLKHGFSGMWGQVETTCPIAVKKRFRASLRGSPEGLPYRELAPWPPGMRRHETMPRRTAPDTIDFSPAERRRIRTELLRWYVRSGRDLPWRRKPTPYRTWISEAMLQQTQVNTVIPYYRRFLKQFPSVKALAESKEDDVLKVWEGLGYYSRGRNLRKAAQRIRRELGGRFPRTLDGLMSLPGIGRYTAGAIASIAMGQDAAVVDGNVIRVFARLLNDSRDVSKPPTKEAYWGVAERLMPSGRAGDFNQALMDLGATVCKPRTPRCEHCPLRRVCRSQAEGTQGQLPNKSRRPPVPHYQIGVGVVWKKGKVLIARRPSSGMLGGLWEFPGGKQMAGEPIRECIRREVKEELGVHVDIGPHMMTVDHAYSHFKVTLHFYECAHASGRPKTLSCSAWKWIAPGEIRKYAFPAGSMKAVDIVAALAKDR